MKTEETAGHSKDSETAMQRREKRSSDENRITSNEEDTTVKRKKSIAIGTDSDDRVEVMIKKTMPEAMNRI